RVTTSRQRASLGDDAADGAGKWRLPRGRGAQGELHCVELRQTIRVPFGAAELLAYTEPQWQHGIAEAAFDGADQRRKALRLAGDGQVPLGAARAAQCLVAIAAAVREGDERDRIVVVRGRHVAEPCQGLEGDGLEGDRRARFVRRRALEE